MAEAVSLVRSQLAVAPLRHGAGWFVAGTGLALTLAALARRVLEALGGGLPAPLLASVMAGAATGLGALVLLARRPAGADAARLFAAGAAGAMLAAAVFSLLAPAIATTGQTLALDVAAAAVAGWAAMSLIGRTAPELSDAAERGLGLRTAGLVVAGIAAHNLPEGFAVGAGFGAGDALGWRMAASIGLQNVPEGLIVATALRVVGATRLRAAAVALGTGLIEPVGALAGIALVDLAPSLLPVALAVAAGAMLQVTVRELLPAALAPAGRRAGVVTLLGAFIAMAALTA